MNSDEECRFCEAMARELYMRRMQVAALRTLGVSLVNALQLLVPSAYTEAIELLKATKKNLEEFKL